MKKALSLIAILLGAVLVSGCVKPDPEYTHDHYTISAIYLQPAVSSQSISIQGTINKETGDILFTIPKEIRKSVDITQVKLRANINYDAFIEPPLTGIKDLSSPMEITVTARMTGNSKKYTLQAAYQK